jgi:hypothetical protein
MESKKILNQIESVCREGRIMEKHYGVNSFSESDPYFADSQETDIKEMISDGLDIKEIVSIIKKW